MPVTARDLEAYQRCWATQSRRLSSSRHSRISSAAIWTGSLIPRCLPFFGQLNPVEAAGCQGEQVRQLAYAREPRHPEHLYRIAAFEGTQVELDCLGRAGQVVHAEHQVVLEAPDV